MKLSDQSILQAFLAAALAFGGALVCRQSSQAESPQVRPAQAEPSQAESPDRAIAQVRTHLEADPPDFQTAHDFVLAAMRISPESPDVFAVAVEFVKQAHGAAGEDDALALAYDLFARLEALIPFQPVDEIVGARAQVREIGKLLEPTIEEVEPHVSETFDPIASVSAKLERAKSAEWSPEVQSRVLQRLREELDSAMVEAVLIEPQASNEIAKRWRQATDEIDVEETKVLTHLYSALSERLQDFMARSEKTLKDCNDQQQARVSGFFGEIDKRLVEHQEEGQRLFAEMAPFTVAAVGAASEDSKALEARLVLLDRTRQWMHSQYALQLIKYLNEQKLSPSDSLKRLAKCDERKLIPYVLSRYQEAWDKWFAELDEVEKLQAVKWSIIREESR